MITFFHKKMHLTVFDEGNMVALIKVPFKGYGKLWFPWQPSREQLGIFLVLVISGTK